MRQIVLDTETTGIGHEQGHRIIEIGCVEIFDRKLTGNHYHAYINPEREVDEGAFKVHGISNQFLANKPTFDKVVSEFVTFVKGAELIIHNAPFDVGFLNAELSLVNWGKKLEEFCSITDTLEMARKKHPGQRNSLDALCKRYDIDNSNRTLHGALLDAEILAVVYLAMTGGQASLFGDQSQEKKTSHHAHVIHHQPLNNNSPIIFASNDELEAHSKILDFIKNKSGIDLWSEN